MTETSYPFFNQDTSEVQYSTLASKWQEIAGVDGELGDTNLKVVGDSSGMQIKLQIGFAIVRGYAYNTDAVVTKAVTAASAFARQDLVVLRCDPSTDTITPTVLAGTAANTDPAITQTATGIYDLPLARLLVATSTTTIAPANVVDLRKFLGLHVGRWQDDTQRPLAPKKGKPGFNLASGKMEYHDGTQWRTFGYDAGDITSGTLARPVSGDLVSGRVKGKIIDVQQATPTPDGVGHMWVSW